MDRRCLKPGLTRRVVLQRVAGSTAIMASGAAVAADGSDETPSGDQADSTVIARRSLGKTGVKVTRLGMGASFPTYGRRMLDLCFARGVRYFDNSESYINGKAESELGEWIHRRRRREGFREDIFVVTKAKTFEPDRFEERVHRSLQRLRIDTIDLMFVHGIDDPEIPKDPGGKWRKIKDKLVREGKIRFMGFSTHTVPMARRTACLNEAARSGWVDSLMVACDPGLIADNDDFNRALDACAKANVGLVAMKTSRGLGKMLNQPHQTVEIFKTLNMTPHQAMIAGMWSDERFASVCSEMTSRSIVAENTGLDREFTRPFDADQRKMLLEGIRSLARATCPGCTGACREAAGTQTDFCSIARYLAYYEEDGKHEEARRLYRELPGAARDWRGADLRAARDACPYHLDFEMLLQNARTRLGST